MRRSGERSRDIAAWLARRLTSLTLRELAPRFGLGHPDSVSNLIRRAETAIAETSKLKRDTAKIKQLIKKTENRV